MHPKQYLEGYLWTPIDISEEILKINEPSKHLKHLGKQTQREQKEENNKDNVEINEIGE